MHAYNSSTIDNSQKVKEPNVDQFIYKNKYISQNLFIQRCILYNVILLNHKNNEILSHVTTLMNFENMLKERSQTQKITYCMIPFIQNIHERLIHTHRTQIDGCHGLGQGCQTHFHQGTYWPHN